MDLTNREQVVRAITDLNAKANVEDRKAERLNERAWKHKNAASDYRKQAQELREEARASLGGAPHRLTPLQLRAEAMALYGDIIEDLVPDDDDA